MRTAAKIGIGVGVLALGAVAMGGGGKQGGAAPQRVPTQPPAKPDTPKGDDRSDDEGRSWDTFYVNRDERKHYEMFVLSVAESAGNAAIGTGEVIVDLYETIVAPADWEWQGASCGAARFRLKFVAGHLVGSPALVTSASPGKPLPSCSSVRPPATVYRRKLHWIQVGPNVLLAIDTDSGLNMLTPDSIAYPPKGRFASRDNGEWYNGFVASGYVVFDASWIFNPGG